MKSSRLITTSLALCLLFVIESGKANTGIQSQRKQYLDARQALVDGHLTRYRKTSKGLKDYPLYPYLLYYDLLRRMRWLPERDIRNFLKDYANTPLANRLRYRWLKRLAKQGEWGRFQRDYDPSLNSTELTCHSLWAQHKLGNTDHALAQVKALWLVGYSQPDACNSIFKLWKNQGLLTNNLAWQRFNLAMHNRKTQLARYLIRFMSGETEQHARLYRELYYNPHKLKKKRHFKKNIHALQSMVLHAFRRLAIKDPVLASQLWPGYQKHFDFPDPDAAKTDHSITIQLARQDFPELFFERLGNYSHLPEPVLEAGILMSLRHDQWQQTKELIEHLPESVRNTPRFQYWYARTLIQLANEPSLQAWQLLENISKKRDYYGFLAADILSKDYHFNHKQNRIDRDFLTRFSRNPAVIRAIELKAADELTNARREWRYASRNLNKDQIYSTAYLALESGWHSQAIRSAIDAERWNDLILRFPLIYEHHFKTAAQERGLDANWLFAVARQESALTPDARSHKGASGLLQLMPATAKAVAKKHGIAYRNRQALFEPQYNIELAAHYMKDMLEITQQNIAYATASYNAGPHRVKTWRNKFKSLHVDIWIENIPFAETRQYVKNVLTYSVIYAYRGEQNLYRMATYANFETIRDRLAQIQPEPETKNSN